MYTKLSNDHFSTSIITYALLYFVYVALVTGNVKQTDDIHLC